MYTKIMSSGKRLKADATPARAKAPRARRKQATAPVVSAVTEPEIAARTTSIMQQYREAKERHPGMLLLFRMGDFYELFDADAEVASRVLGLTLTSRDKTIPMAGFPHHALEPYLRKLLHAWHRGGICDQVEDPA